MSCYTTTWSSSTYSSTKVVVVEGITIAYPNNLLNHILELAAARPQLPTDMSKC
jgi:hypothetical protein